MLYTTYLHEERSLFLSCVAVVHCRGVAPPLSCHLTFSLIAYNTSENVLSNVREALCEMNVPYSVVLYILKVVGSAPHALRGGLESLQSFIVYQQQCHIRNVWTHGISQGSPPPLFLPLALRRVNSTHTAGTLL